MMSASYLAAKGIHVQRQRVRSALRTVDPVGTCVRFDRATQRRRYSVPSPNSLWHIDGHMKLIRWGIATHGAIDGYSRLIVYLSCSCNNKASTVLEKFVIACSQYGLPAKVRSDHGREHIMVGLFMNLINGLDQNSILTGRSVHNQRIERLWRDVYQHVIDIFYQLFYRMEDDRVLCLESEVNVFALRFVFIPIINAHLEQFRSGWNKHKMRTERNRTPEQTWLDGVLENRHSSSPAVSNIFDSPILTKLTDALQEFGLSVADFPEVDTEPTLLSAEQKTELEQIVNRKEDYREKYVACAEALQRLQIFP